MPVLNTSSPAIDFMAPKEIPSTSRPSSKISFPFTAVLANELICPLGESDRDARVEFLVLVVFAPLASDDFLFMLQSFFCY